VPNEARYRAYYGQRSPAQENTRRVLEAECKRRFKLEPATQTTASRWQLLFRDLGFSCARERRSRAAPWRLIPTIKKRAIVARAKRTFKISTMVAVDSAELIERAAGEAFMQLAKTSIVSSGTRTHTHNASPPLPTRSRTRFISARHDRGSLIRRALLHDLGEVAMERDYIQAERALDAEDGST
jgi:hypothetical protein